MEDGVGVDVGLGDGVEDGVGVDVDAALGAGAESRGAALSAGVAVSVAAGGRARPRASSGFGSGCEQAAPNMTAEVSATKYNRGLISFAFQRQYGCGRRASREVYLDTDFKFLYRRGMDGNRRPPEFSNLGIGLLRFEEWFEPFLNATTPVHPYSAE